MKSISKLESIKSQEESSKKYENYRNNYIRDNYKRVTLLLPKGLIDIPVIKWCEFANVSMNSFINEAINEKVKSLYVQGEFKKYNYELPQEVIEYLEIY